MSGSALYPTDMRLLFLGDIVGRPGRNAIRDRLKPLRDRLRADFVVVNGENATSGAGISPDHAKAVLDAGVDVLTLGDHAFDQRDMLSFIDREPRILRPINFAKSAPGTGARVFDAPGGRKILIAQVLGQVFMKRAFDDPFSAVDATLRAHPLGGLVQASLVEIHCEATSEKMAMGHFCDGRTSAVIGSHTHVPTADEEILPQGTAYVSDLGMTGGYHSVIGRQVKSVVYSMTTRMYAPFGVSEENVRSTGVIIEVDNATGRATSIERVTIRAED